MKRFEMDKVSRVCRKKLLNWVEHNPKKWDNAFYRGQLWSIKDKVCGRSK